MVVKIDSDRNIVFIGEQDVIETLCNSLRIFNKKNKTSVYTKFLNAQGFVLDDVLPIDEQIYNLYINYYSCYPIEAEIRASSFKKLINYGSR